MERPLSNACRDGCVGDCNAVIVARGPDTPLLLSTDAVTSKQYLLLQGWPYWRSAVLVGSGK